MIQTVRSAMSIVGGNSTMSEQEKREADREPCVACGTEIESTVTMMYAHWTLECEEADDYEGTA